ncbi:hypothetical protein Gohar_021192, partial [Gossypium harknessii]|nr:hypothetical protein [Gossypium harknessii]
MAMVVLAIVGGISTLLLVLGLVWLFCRREKYSRMREDRAMSVNREMEMVTAARKFSYRELRFATSNFADEGLLGEGGFGKVYLGFLSNINCSIAVKRKTPNSHQGVKEIRSSSLCTSSFQIRVSITINIESHDIKSSNVLLELSFNAKLGDLGLARVVDHGQGSQKTKVMLGTDGYIAPKCLDTYKAIKESDLYSFGIVALEIVSGKKAIALIERNGQRFKTKLVEWVWELYGKESLFDAADPR